MTLVNSFTLKVNNNKIIRLFWENKFIPKKVFVSNRIVTQQSKRSESYPHEELDLLLYYMKKTNTVKLVPVWSLHY